MREEEGAPPGREPAWSGGWPQTEAEFERLVEVCQGRLVRYAWRRLGSRTDAEDVAQEVFARAYADRQRRREVASVVAYLYRMAGNLCTDHLRRCEQRLRVPLEETRIIEIPSNEPNGAELAAAAEEVRRVEELLAMIPERQAEAVRLFILDELTTREIGEILDCPEATIKSRVRYGLDKLREIIIQEREEVR